MALAVARRKTSSTPIAMDSAVTLDPVGTKQTKRIPDKPREAFARVLKHLVDTKYEGNQTRAGEALGVTQGHISAMIRGERGPGLNTLLLMRLETGKTIDEMLGFEASPTEDLSRRLVASVEMEVGRLRAESRAMREEVERVRRERPAERESSSSVSKKSPRKRSGGEK